MIFTKLGFNQHDKEKKPHFKGKKALKTLFTTKKHYHEKSTKNTLVF